MKQAIKVLIFDDDVMTLRIQSTILSRKGFRVYTCDTALNIFSTLEKYTPDIILMDQDMPSISGIEAIRQLKANALSSSIPVIFFSLYENMAEQAIKAGAAQYMSKASTADDLSNCIENIVRG